MSEWGKGKRFRQPAYYLRIRNDPAMADPRMCFKRQIDELSARLSGSIYATLNTPCDKAKAMNHGCRVIGAASENMLLLRSIWVFNHSRFKELIIFRLFSVRKV